jgi:large repetitive protein
MIRRATLPLALVTLAVRVGADVPGRVFSAGGAPLAGASITAYAPEIPEARARRLLAGQERSALHTAKTGADGSFRLLTGDVAVTVAIRAEGFGPAFATGFRGEPLTVTLEPAVTRRGKVTALGKPIQDAIVVWTPEIGEGELVARTAQDGTYEIAAGPGPAALNILHRDFAPLSVPRLPSAVSLRHELRPGIALQGRVIDERTGAGLAGATVCVDGWPLAESAAEGAFAVAHAPADWKTLSAATRALVGTAKPGSVPLVITMTPARRLAGVVRDAKTRLALPGVRVGVTTGEGEPGRSATTDVRGQYEISSLDARVYWASVSRPGYVSGVSGGDGSQKLDLRKATFARRDFELVPKRRVTGRVQDEKARPIEGAWVTLGVQGLGTFYGDLDRLDPRRDSEASGRTGARSAADGTFALTVPEGVATGSGASRTWLVALKPGHAAGTAVLPPTPAVRPVVITLPKGVTLSGRVRSEEGTPLGGVGIALAEVAPLRSVLAAPTPTGQSVPEWSRSDAEGRFAIPVQPVPHELVFRKAGHAPRRVEAFDPRRGELVVTLERGAVLGGHVLRHDGRGVADAHVSLQDATAKDVVGTLSEADGSFRIDDLQPGPYDLTVTTPSGSTVQRTIEVPAADVRIQLGPTTTVRGRVVEAATRSPVARFQVTLQRASGVDAPPDEEDSNGRSQSFAGVDGGFVMEEVPLGDMTLTVRAEGYRPQQIEHLAVSSEAPLPEVEVSLDAGLAIRGRVTSTEGVALAGADVSAQAGLEHQATVATDENGEYVLTAMAPGQVDLEFRKPGFLSARRTAQIQEPTRMDVKLSRGHALRGVAVADGVSVANVQVHASSSTQGAEPQSTLTDQAGQFTVQGLAPGRYDVTASSSEHGTAQLHDVDVATAGRLRLVLSRHPTAILSGTVVGLAADDGARAPMVTVHVQSEEAAGVESGIADLSGAFRIEHAPAGRVTVMGQALYADGRSRSSLSKELALVAGSETATVIEFSDDLFVSGTVSRAGVGLPEASVTFSDGLSPGSASRTDRDGRYEVSLAPGTYSVAVSANGVAYQTRYVAVGSAVFDIDVTGGALRGRVVEAGSAAPVADATISVWLAGAPEPTPVSTLRSSAEGTFEAASLPDGRYRIVVAKKGYGEQVREVEISAGSSAVVLFDLERPSPQ